MIALVRTALLLLTLLSILTGILYPLAVTGLSGRLFPRQAAGSLASRDGVVLGSSLLGQEFTDPAFFWGRLSATPGRPYNAAHSGGSNLGPMSEALLEAARTRLAALRAADPGNRAPVPVDLVTASASGLDPHISPAAARYQAARVARARGLTEAEVGRRIAAATEGRLGGVFGEPRVNVLLLNLSLEP